MSIGCNISGLQEGAIRFKSLFFFLIINPKSVKILIISFTEILNPVTLSNKSKGNLIDIFLKISLFCTSNLLISPPHISWISLAALTSPSSIEFGSIPLSNLNFASVSIFNNFEVFLIDFGLKYADSNKIFLVSNSVPDLVPPIIPPSPKTPD